MIMGVVSHYQVLWSSAVFYDRYSGSDDGDDGNVTINCRAMPLYSVTITWPGLFGDGDCGERHLPGIRDATRHATRSRTT